MPRFKGVTQENILHVDRYFANALRSNRLLTSANFNLLNEAKEAFHKLPVIDWKNEAAKKLSLAERRVALQTWIDKFVTPEKWQRCLLTLRQNKSRKKLKLRRLDLQQEIYLTLKALAKKQQLSLGETIYRLAKPALDKIYKKELTDEQPLKLKKR